MRAVDRARLTLMTTTLLVIDDEPGMLKLVERFAEPLGMTVVSHGGGRAALSHVSLVKPDVVLVDLQMPEVTGLDVLRVIRESHPNCAVILMTGHASVHTAIEAVRLGALDYPEKPLPLDRLRELSMPVACSGRSPASARPPNACFRAHPGPATSVSGAM